MIKVKAMTNKLVCIHSLIKVIENSDIKLSERFFSMNIIQRKLCQIIE